MSPFAVNSSIISLRNISTGRQSKNSKGLMVFLTFKKRIRGEAEKVTRHAIEDAAFLFKKLSHLLASEQSLSCRRQVSLSKGFGEISEVGQKQK